VYKKTAQVVLLASLGIAALFCLSAGGQTLRVQAADESELVTLYGNTRPEANLQNDRGPVDDSLPLDHLLLQLKRLPEQEAAAQKFLDEQQDPLSPNYHQWLTEAQFGERFGTAEQDLEAVTRWLGAHGFAVNQVHRNGMLVDFSGTAGQVRDTFHAEIHHLDVNGVQHIANMSDPQIPAALAPVVEGIVSLHDCMPHALNTARTDYTFTSGGSTYQAVVPGDLATIYDFSPAYGKGYTGTGQTIVVIEDSDVYSVNDFNTFRSTFGLSRTFPAGSLTQVHPSGPAGNCTDPGVNSDDAEAEIDVEWASAAAPSATIELASCADTRTNFGGFIALQNLLASKPPAIVSISYGESEAELGASGNAYINSLYQTAAAAGVSVFVSAGDEGAASSDAGASSATHGITVSGFASTPHNVAVGGTDFADTYQGKNSHYWSSTNGPYFSSALTYIPEIPWNDSCASQLIATYVGYATTYGANGFCNSSMASAYGMLTGVAGSGGPSNCDGNPLQVGHRQRNMQRIP
jgi:subtilase family serine protease